MSGCTTNSLQEPRTGERVLLVEDSRAIASLLASELERLPGTECVHFETLADTGARLSERCDDILVAVLDLNLPDAPNGEVVELVQSYGIPVIVLTGDLDRERRDYFLQRQVADYVSKSHPAGIRSVVRLVDRIRANRSYRILVVEDSVAQRSAVCALLHNHGYQTLEAGSGEQALDILQNYPNVRLMVVDYHMPGMDGLALVQKIRASRPADELGIIGLSGAGDPGVLARFLKAGASDFLTKPFETEELYCRIDQNLDMLRYIQEARDAANCDFLTQLYNRRYFFKQAERLHARALRGELRLMVAMMDADHFKLINDTHGHDTGDDALVAMANVLKERSGDEGFPARFGGEEFVCVSVLDAEQDPLVCLNGLREDIAAIELTAPSGDRVPLSVSIGATLNLGESIDQMLSIADEAVYLAKEQGRNRVVMLEEQLSASHPESRVRAR